MLEKKWVVILCPRDFIQRELRGIIKVSYNVPKFTKIAYIAGPTDSTTRYANTARFYANAGKLL